MKKFNINDKVRTLPMRVIEDDLAGEFSAMCVESNGLKALYPFSIIELVPPIDPDVRTAVLRGLCLVAANWSHDKVTTVIESIHSSGFDIVRKEVRP